MQAARFAVPLDVGEEGEIYADLCYGNHSSYGRHQKLVIERLVADIANGRVVSIHEAEAKKHSTYMNITIGSSGRKTESRVILDLSFGDGESRNGWQRVKGDTDFELAPARELANVMN